MLEALQREADTRGELDWSIHFVDGTVIRAHQSAAGAIGGQQHESLYLGPLLDLGRVQRATVGRPRNRPGAIVGDKGYSYSTVRRMLARRGIRAVIPRRSNQRPLDRRHHFDAIRYRQRNRVERLVGRLKPYRRIATRYEKRAAHFLAMLTVAALLLWL